MVARKHSHLLAASAQLQVAAAAATVQASEAALVVMAGVVYGVGKTGAVLASSENVEPAMELKTAVFAAAAAPVAGEPATIAGVNRQGPRDFHRHAAVGNAPI